MANWQRRLNLADIYHAGIPVHELAGMVAERLASISVPGGDEYLTDERDEIISEFRDMAEDPAVNTSDFDQVMERQIGRAHV